MIYRVRHATQYAYSTPVELAAHLMHLRPLASAQQMVRDQKLTVTPNGGRLVERTDHYGNQVSWLFLDRPHTAFEVVSEAIVEVRTPAPPDPAGTLSWETIRAMAERGGADAWDAAEFRFASPRVPMLAEAREYALPSFPPGRPILAGLIDLTERFFRDFTFRAGATTISTPIAQVLERREGVCQDFTHLMLSALRGLGLPARYTSGYIRTRPPPGEKRRRGADVSHAWVGGWLGPDLGWLGFDPTNGIVVADEHVVLATGRDFSDISPLRGMILGGGQHTMRVGVDLEPLDPDE